MSKTGLRRLHADEVDALISERTSPTRAPHGRRGRLASAAWSCFVGEDDEGRTSMPDIHETVIRTARPDDFARISRLTDALDELHRERLPWMFKAPDAQPRPEPFFANLLNR